MAEPHPVYLVKGDDAALVGRALDMLLSEISAGTDVDVREISEAEGIGAVLDACLTPAFLAPRRLVLVRNAGRFRADDVVPLVEYIAAPLATTTLVLTGGGGAVPTRLAKAVKDHGHVTDATTPFGKGRTTWIHNRVRKGPVRLDGAAISVLVEHLGEDLGQLDGILDAVAAAHGEGNSIGVDELRPYLGVGGAAAPWELTDAIDAGDIPGALVQLHKMIGPGGRHPLVVMATLSRHFSMLLRLDGSDVTNEADAASLLGVAAFPAKKALEQSRVLGSKPIARAIELVSQADLDLRGASAWPPETVLEVLVARLTKLAPDRSRVNKSPKKRAG